MAGLAAGSMSVLGARIRANLPSVISGPSAGRGLLQESNDSLVGVVLSRQITHAGRLMSLLCFSQTHLLPWPVIFLVFSQQMKEKQDVQLPHSHYRVRILV